MHVQVEKIPHTYVLRRYSKSDSNFDRRDHPIVGPNGVKESYKTKMLSLDAMQLLVWTEGWTLQECVPKNPNFKRTVAANNKSKAKSGRPRGESCGGGCGRKAVRRTPMDEWEEGNDVEGCSVEGDGNGKPSDGEWENESV
uniref:Uncharacterized protein n=1 Tax=Oryza nivara TaxID=4536 RepID=A0A0E0G6N8_ORYNI